MKKGISGKGWRHETKKLRRKKKGGVCMEYYQEMVETEAGIPARIYYGGTGRDKLYYPLHWHRNWNLIW